MASADCVTSIGAWSYATPTKNGAADCKTYVGFNSAASRVAWAGSTARRERVEWMPRADEPWFDPKTGRPTRRFYQFMHEIAEQRLGGVNGRTVPQVADDLTTTQGTVTATVNFATQAVQYSESVAATANATAEVLQANGEPGADTIPPAEERGPAWVDGAD